MLEVPKSLECRLQRLAPRLSAMFAALTLLVSGERSHAQISNTAVSNIPPQPEQRSGGNTNRATEADSTRGQSSSLTDKTIAVLKNGDAAAAFTLFSQAPMEERHRIMMLVLDSTHKAVDLSASLNFCLLANQATVTNFTHALLSPYLLRLSLAHCIDNQDRFKTYRPTEQVIGIAVDPAAPKPYKDMLCGDLLMFLAQKGGTKEVVAELFTVMTANSAVALDLQQRTWVLDAGRDAGLEPVPAYIKKSAADRTASGEIRRPAIAALQGVGDEESLTLLRKIVSDPTEEVGMRSVAAINLPLKA